MKMTRADAARATAEATMHISAVATEEAEEESSAAGYSSAAGASTLSATSFMVVFSGVCVPEAAPAAA